MLVTRMPNINGIISRSDVHFDYWYVGDIHTCAFTSSAKNLACVYHSHSVTESLNSQGADELYRRCKARLIKKAKKRYGDKFMGKFKLAIINFHASLACMTDCSTYHGYMGVPDSGGTDGVGYEMIAGGTVVKYN